MIIQFGGKVLTVMFLKKVQTGSATVGQKIAEQKVHILTQDLQLLLVSALVFLLNLNLLKVFPFQLSYSAEEEQKQLRSYTSHSTGSTVYLLVLQWHLKQQLLQQAQLVL